MTDSLGDEIDSAVEEAKANGAMLAVAPLAKELSRRFGYSARSIARQIIERGIHAGISMDMRMPDGEGT